MRRYRRGYGWCVIMMGAVCMSLVAQEPAVREGGFFMHPRQGFWDAPVPRRELIVVVRPGVPSPDPVASAAAPPARTQAESRTPRYHPEVFVSPEQADAFRTYYQRFYDHPLQVWVPTDLGPVPLFNDVVHDSEGRPVPRLPDPHTYLAMTNPNPHTIALWQIQRQGALRQFRVAQGHLIPVAEDLDIISPEHLMVQRSTEPDAMTLGDMSVVEPSSRGARIYTPEQARAIGMPGAEIRTPGPANLLEVLWFWDHRCTFSTAAAEDWARFAADVTASGYKASGISMDNDVARVAAQLEFWILRGLPFQHTRNYQDVTDLRTALAIDKTPTYLFINRATGTMARLDGRQTTATLRRTFMTTAGWSPEAWPPPSTDGQRAMMVRRDGTRPTVPAMDDPPPATAPPVSGLEASHILPPSDRIRSAP